MCIYGTLILLYFNRVPYQQVCEFQPNSGYYYFHCYLQIEIVCTGWPWKLSHFRSNFAHWKFLIVYVYNFSSLFLDVAKILLEYIWCPMLNGIGLKSGFLMFLLAWYVMYLPEVQLGFGSRYGHIYCYKSARKMHLRFI